MKARDVLGAVACVAFAVMVLVLAWLVSLARERMDRIEERQRQILERLDRPSIRRER